MNDFLKHLEVERRKREHESGWQEWSRAHKADGFAVWDTSRSQDVSASITTFLRMVPRQLFEEGLVLTAPRYLHDTLQLVPGVVRTNDRFLDLKGASQEARSAWQGHSIRIGFVRVIRTYYEEGYRSTRQHLVLADRRVTGTEGLHYPRDVELLYEAMAQFSVAHGL